MRFFVYSLSKNMKSFYNTRIIGVDAGYGNMKTASFCFRTGINAYETERSSPEIC